MRAQMPNGCVAGTSLEVSQSSASLALPTVLSKCLDAQPEQQPWGP